MGLVIDNFSNFIPMPHKRLIDDIITRDGEYSEESYFPSSGVRREVESIYSKYSSGIVFELRNICEGIETDLDLNEVMKKYNEKCRSNCQQIKDVQHPNVLDKIVTDLCKTLAQGPMYHYNQRKHVQDFQYNRRTLCIDEETNDTVLWADEEIDVIGDSYETKKNARKRIPFILKTLCNYSKEDRISYIHMLIYIAKALNTLEDKTQGMLDISVGLVQRYGFVSMYLPKQNEFGSHYGTTLESQNSNRAYSEAFSVITGRRSDLRSIRINELCIELLSLSKLLGYDFADEDPSIYTVSMIHHLQNDYLVDESETLRILSLFNNNDSLFESLTGITDTEFLGHRYMRVYDNFDIINMARNKISVVPKFHYLLTNSRVKGRLSGFVVSADENRSIEYINDDIIEFYNKINNYEEDHPFRVDSVLDLSFNSNEVLCDRSGTPIILSYRDFFKSFQTKEPYSLIMTKKGYIILLDTNEGKCMFSNVHRVLEQLRTNITVDFEELSDLYVNLSTQ